MQCHGTAPECFATARRRDVQVLEGVGGNNGGNRRSKRPESCLRVVPIVSVAARVSRPSPWSPDVISSNRV